MRMHKRSNSYLTNNTQNANINIIERDKENSPDISSSIYYSLKKLFFIYLEINLNTSTLKIINNNNKLSNQIPIKKVKNVNDLKAKLIAVPSSSGILKHKNLNNNSNNYDSNKVYVSNLTRKIINVDGVQKSTQMNDSLSRKQNNHKYTTNEMHTNDSISYIIPRNSKQQLPSKMC